MERYWNGSAWSHETRPQTAFYGGPPATPSAESGNGMGTAAIVLASVGMVVPVLPSILAIIFGSIGISRYTKGEATNVGAARAGLLLGIHIPVVQIITLIVIAAELSSYYSY